MPFWSKIPEALLKLFTKSVLVPDYIAPVIVHAVGNNKPADNQDYLGNSFLVNKEKGLFVTNAHVVKELFIKESGVEFLPYLGVRNKDWRIAYTRKEWVDWETDLAMIALPSQDIPGLSSAAVLSDLIYKNGDSVSFSGYVGKKIQNNDSGSGRFDGFTPYWISCDIADLRSDWGISIPSMLDLSTIVRRSQLGFDIAPEDRAKFYSNYLVIDKKMFEPNFTRGMSGSPIVDEESRVIGIASVALTTFDRMLAVPSSEIKSFLKKVLRSF